MSVNAVTGISREAYNPFNSSTNPAFTGMNNSIWSMDIPFNMTGLGFGNDLGLGMGYGFGMDGFDTFGYSGMPFGGGFGGFPMFMGMGGNYQNYWDQMNEYNQAFTNNQIKNNERMRNSELQYNAPAEEVRLTMGQLREKIQTNNQDQILAAYEDYKNSIKAMYGGTDEQVSARARTLYEQQYKVPLTEDIRNNANGAYYQAFLQSTSGGIGVDDTSAEYNVSQITGQPVGRTQRDKKLAGHAMGGMIPGTVFGSLGGGIIGSFFKKAVADPHNAGQMLIKSKAKPLAIAGAIIGAIAGMVYAAEVGSKKYK